MYLSRRNFIKICTSTVAGFGIAQMFHPAIKEIFAASLTKTPNPVFWVTGQSCTGCSVSLLNNIHPGVAELLLKMISLDFHPTLMAAEGHIAYDYLLKTSEQQKGKYIYVIEGAIPTKHEGKCCVLAEDQNQLLTMTGITDVLAANAALVLAVGTCAAYGGIPAAKGNETGAMGATAYLKTKQITTPIINIAGCPPHPDWIVGTLAMALEAINSNTLDELLATQIGSFKRPREFYKNVHMNCPYLPAYEQEKMCTTLTDKEGCRHSLGCKGMRSACDSFKRQWNNGVNWCVDNATCIGCTEQNFPDGKSPFYVN